MKKCRSCDAPIIWALTPSGRKVPLDAEPSPEGNLRVYDINNPTVAYLRPTDREAAKAGGQPLYISHFATCPQACVWRDGGA